MKYWPDRSSSATQFAFWHDPEQRERCRFKGTASAGFMNPWEIPGRGCDLLAGQREYALRFWPASFHTTWNTRETQAPNV